MRDHPELVDRIRIIDTLGPSSIQPLVATRFVSESLRREVQQIVTAMGGSATERARFEQGLVKKFVPVDDSSYADIGAMLDSVEAVGLRLA
jgi:hypothetical protein